MPSEEDIIALAYSMAIGTERFYELFDAIGARTDAIGLGVCDQANSEDLAGPTLAALEPHFEHALSLMHMGAKQSKKPKHSIKAMEHDAAPQALVQHDGLVVYANAAARAQFDIIPDHAFDSALFEPEMFALFTAALSEIDSCTDNQLIGIFEIRPHNADGIVRIALRRIKGDKQEVFGQISVLTTSWRSDQAAEFKSAMDITPVELEIVRAVVTGLSLSDLASSRGRAVGTVRLQAKTLLKKLHLRSQTELACLYTSFVELHLGTQNRAEPDDVPPSKTHFVTLPSGRIVSYELAGPATGKPVLFFHALLGGTALTPEMRQTLFRRNVKLIMVWRPGFDQSPFDGPAKFEAFERYALDIKALLTQLDIPSCPVVGHITSAMFAFAMGCYVPDCVVRIVTVNGTVPSYSGSHVAALDKQERLRFMLLRRAPKIGRMIVHAALAKVDAGFDEEFLSAFLDNKIDKETMQLPAIRSTFRDAFTKTVAQGYDSFVHELTLGATDWQPLVDRVICPIDLIVGDNNPVYTPALINVYARDRQNISVTAVPNTGHLLFYQDFERVLDAALTTPKT